MLTYPNSKDRLRDKIIAKMRLIIIVSSTLELASNAIFILLCINKRSSSSSSSLTEWYGLYSLSQMHKSFVSYRVIFKKWTEAFSSRLHLPLSKGIFLEHVLTATGTALIPSPHPPHPVCSGKFRNQLATGCFFSKKMNPRGMYSTVIIILFYRQRVQIQVYGLIHFVQFHIVRKWQTQNL